MEQPVWLFRVDSRDVYGAAELRRNLARALGWIIALLGRGMGIIRWLMPCPERDGC